MYEIYTFIFVKGGPVMYPIVLGSIVALALFLERVWVLRRERVSPIGLQTRVRSLVRDGKHAEAAIVCQENGSALATIIHAGLKDADRPRSEIRETITDVGRREVARLEQHVELLGSIAAAEPLMGLLGTVTGLIKAFQAVETLAGKGAGVNPGALASGIWEALITTAAGLIIGIPAYAAYRYLQGRVSMHAVEMEESAFEVARLIGRHEPPPGSTEKPA